jgi:hypothetical protein
MPAEPEALGDGTRSGKESLGVARRLESLHVPLALPGGLVGVLCAIIEIPVLAMFHAWQNLALGRSVALEFVGDEHAGYVRHPFEQLAEEPLRSPFVAAPLD